MRDEMPLERSVLSYNRPIMRAMVVHTPAAIESNPLTLADLEEAGARPPAKSWFA